MTTFTAASRPNLMTAPAIVVAAVYLVALSWAMQHSTYDVWGGMVILPILLGVTLVLVTRGPRREGDLRMVRILAAGLVVKVAVGALVRHALIYGVYGSGDANGYDGAGRIISASLRNGHFPADLGGGGEGTQALNLVTGMIYTVIGPTRLGGFFVFSWLAFLGLYLFYRAYRLAIPEGNHHRYAKFLFFLPTLIFWPSSPGKEAWLMFSLGLLVYGIARVFTRRPGGVIALGLGLLATVAIRPHLAVLILPGLMFGFLLRPGVHEGSVLGNKPSGGKAFGLVVLGVVGLLLVGAAQEYFRLDELDRAALNELLETTGARAGDDGSSYDAINVVDNPVALPWAAVTVFFRPFPFEAGNIQSLAAALEGTFLLGVFVFSAPRLAAGVRQSLRTPFVTMCLTYSLLFVIAFSALGNFGLLARQRSLVYPFVIVLLALPSGRATRRLARRKAQPAIPLVQHALNH